MHSQSAILLAALLILLHPEPGRCWGDEGHEIIGLIAQHHLTPAVRDRVTALLATDESGLTRGTGIAAEATWADKFRDSDRNGAQLRYRKTREWHFIDIEIDRPDLDQACFGHPALPAGGAASDGPAADCILDKIDEFQGELRSRTVGTGEKRLALQFLLHLVGDLHQPLHAADDHDRGGNDVRVVGAGRAPGTLHHYWDTVFVERLGRRPEDVAQVLIAELSPEHRRAWVRGSPVDWALESHELARARVYGPLRRAGAGAMTLDGRYEDDAQRVVAEQMQRAGLRLARLLNDALG